MTESHELVLRPIGRVLKGRTRKGPDDEWKDKEAEIEIDPAWEPALDGIEGFSHIWIVWWLDRTDQTSIALKVHPQRRQELPAVGLFATRSPLRPNPIALTVVRLLKREGSHLRVQGLDAFQDTPILDIKPYLRRGDLIPEATMPEWIEHLWDMADEERHP
jgi:tRNA-Thr(GGU) m(6)t(6)A37 methyltransferase TsaA